MIILEQLQGRYLEEARHNYDSSGSNKTDQDVGEVSDDTQVVQVHQAIFLADANVKDLKPRRRQTYHLNKPCELFYEN